jgi:hypothetical protein
LEEVHKKGAFFEQCVGQARVISIAAARRCLPGQPSITVVEGATTKWIV